MHLGAGTKRAPFWALNPTVLLAGGVPGGLSVRGWCRLPQKALPPSEGNSGQEAQEETLWVARLGHALPSDLISHSADVCSGLCLILIGSNPGGKERLYLLSPSQMSTHTFKTTVMFMKI